MYFLLSPAKNLNETDTPPHDLSQHYSQPALMPHACDVMASLKPLEPTDLMSLMSISDKLAQTNAIRNQQWAWDENQPFTPDTAKPAIYLFDGDVYTGLDAYHLTQDQILYLNNHLGILSGLYGLLKPLDLILPYRLEMGTKLKNCQGDNLYQFWDNHITQLINQRMSENNDKFLINLASNEYFKAVQPKQISAPIITPRFEDSKNGEYKVISFYAKKARGLMVKFACQNNITHLDDLKNFDLEGYYFVENLSNNHDWVFRRNHD